MAARLVQTSAAYIRRSLANRSVISISASSSGCRTMIMPSQIRVARQSRRCAPIGSRSSTHDVVAVLGQQLVQPLDAGDAARSPAPA